MQRRPYPICAQRKWWMCDRKMGRLGLKPKPRCTGSNLYASQKVVCRRHKWNFRDAPLNQIEEHHLESLVSSLCHLRAIHRVSSERPLHHTRDRRQVIVSAATIVTNFPSKSWYSNSALKHAEPEVRSWSEIEQRLFEKRTHRNESPTWVRYRFLLPIYFDYSLSGSVLPLYSPSNYYWCMQEFEDE